MRGELGEGAAVSFGIEQDEVEGTLNVCKDKLIQKLFSHKK